MLNSYKKSKSKAWKLDKKKNLRKFIKSTGDWQRHVLFYWFINLWYVQIGCMVFTVSRYDSELYVVFFWKFTKKIVTCAYAIKQKRSIQMEVQTLGSSTFSSSHHFKRNHLWPNTDMMAKQINLNIYCKFVCFCFNLTLFLLINKKKDDESLYNFYLFLCKFDQTDAFNVQPKSKPFHVNLIFIKLVTTTCRYAHA